MQLATVITLPLPVPGSIAELITFLTWGLFGLLPDPLGTPSITSHNEPLLCRAGCGFSLLVPSSARHNWYYAHVPRRVPAGRGEGSRLSMPAAAALAGRPCASAQYTVECVPSFPLSSLKTIIRVCFFVFFEAVSRLFFLISMSEHLFRVLRTIERGVSCRGTWSP